MAFHNVALIGGTGNLGPKILQALQEATPPFAVRVLARPTSSLHASPPSGATVVSVTVSDGHDALVAALKGIDAVVSSVGNPTFADQKAWLDAAVDAGVKRFILSEFATDLDHPDSRNLEVFKEKRATREYAESLAAEGKIEWTSILTGPFLDMMVGPKSGTFFRVNVQARTAGLFDGGDKRWSSSTLRDTGLAVAGVLSGSSSSDVTTRNSVVYVHSLALTQLEAVAALSTVFPGAPFTTSVVSTDQLLTDGTARVRAGDFSGMPMQIARAAFGPGHGNDFTGREVSAKLGVRGIDGKAGLEQFIRETWAA